MTEENRTDPDTNTDDEIGDLELGANDAESALDAAEAPAQAAVASVPPPAPSGPRTFPQHYTLMLGCAFVFAASLSEWERAHVLGKSVSGLSMVTGAFLMAMSLYGLLVGVLNITHGRLKGMLSSFVTGASALYFGIMAFLRTQGSTGCLGINEINNFVKDNSAIPPRFAETGFPFPVETLKSFDDKKQVYTHWVGQFGPGVWLSIIGGAIIVMVFLKAFFPSKKAAEPAPAPRRARRR